MNPLSVRDHANYSRQRAQSFGLADCIHFAPQWQRRLDALYRELHAMAGQVWWLGAIGLLSDGRIAIVWASAGIAERVRP
jgi:hypothetical protein